ncbi:Hypothetical predicted protein [Olea europaea subsp. europaea]|uniref:Uncharacterized protein n=1 Tax=Olea europaea subsp. europaea TaxID=158383 RepID=A0A8S0RX87_OLEEU|nr:Hypothetical predicted protein [Olea europaea subsp. europaea]
MDADGDSPPFWSQPTTTTFFYSHRRPRQPSPIFNPVILILAIPVLILVMLFFLVPPFISHTTQILHLNSVKKGWDSLIIVLVLFAILCGVFATVNNDFPSSDAADQQNLHVSQVSDFPRPQPGESVSSSLWYGFFGEKEYGGNVSSTPVRVGDGGGTRLRRSSSSYPDLRQESLRETRDNRFRFSDDFETSPVVENFHRGARWSEVDRNEPDTPVKVIPVDKYEVSTPPQPPIPPKSPAPPPPPQQHAASLKSRRSSRSVPKKEIFEKQRNDDKFNENRSPPPPPPRPPPPPQPQQPVAKSQFPEVKSEIIHRKKSPTTKEIATAIASLYNKSQRKRKRKKKVKTRNIYDTASASENSSPEQTGTAAARPPPPPPSKLLQNMLKMRVKNKRVHSVSNTAPPPPPPNSIFNNIFKKGSKSKRFQSSSTTAPPPPSPPSILSSLFKNGTQSRRFKNISTPSPPSPPAPPPPPEPRRYHSVNAGKPPKPNKRSSYSNESVIIAPSSPLIPMPPPPPPFKMKEMKFVERGDFVRISSAHSSQCSSPPPELEDSDLMSVKSEGGDSIGPSVSCPSPDVNVKAETFITRRHNEWKQDKMNSIKEKRKLG